ncbi:M23 family metallopeptidase [Patescibacteria group bacterium]|nr:M23 family metallopeptidase [Patescibacteria group bacterium]
MKKLLIISSMILGIVLLPTTLATDVTQAEEIQVNIPDVAQEVEYIPEIATGEIPKLSLPFNVASQWTSADSSTAGVTWQAGDQNIRFAIQGGKFATSSPDDTWFVYGWFGPIKAIQEDYNIKYPQWGDRHNGIDFAGRVGLEITSANNGKVVFAGNKYGKTVVVEAGKYKITYSHLQDIVVKVGDIVQTGELIGHLGTSGTVNPHLHFEVDKIEAGVRWAINPVPLINANWNKVIIPNAKANQFLNEKTPFEQTNFVW